MTLDWIAMRRAFAAALFTGAAAFSGPALAEDEDAGEDAEEADEGLPTIEDETEGYEKADGLFPLYTDPETGKVYLEIAEDKLGAEFIAFSYTENGVLPAGHFRGAYRDNRIVSFNRYYERIEVVEVNTAFYFDEENAIARAKDANLSDAVLSALDIIAETPGEEGARFLVSADKLFLSEALHKVSPSPDPDAPARAFSVGSLAKDRTKFAALRNYPQNTDIVVDYVFKNDAPMAGGGAPVTDPRAITVTMQHSLIAMPAAGYEPRRDDYRVGFFTDQATDLTSADAAPYHDFITRWRLEKKDPEAAVSDPVKPIVWWIENTTPVEYRDTIRDAVLSWNAAFEQAGFSNAIEVKVQPDDADWDAGDIRYNVLRWTSSPIPPFGGYGPSFTNPRTGEIIGADVMLEYSFITNRMVLSDVFDTAGHAGAPGLHADLHAGGAQSGRLCALSEQMKADAGFARAALEADGASEEEIDRLVREEIYYLLLHEVGHTLGLSHNMKASSLYGPREVHDPEVTQGSPTASVMDYPAVNLAPPGVPQGDFVNTRPGPYDVWAIRFGYDPAMTGDAREALLARSTEPGHIFGNDADDMRYPGFGIDPRVMINDMSSDPVAYSIDRIALVRDTLPRLVARYDDEASWQALVRAYYYATSRHAVAAIVMSRQIGGIYVDRTAPGQDGVMDAPFTPVPRARQKAAMKALARDVFAPDAFEAPDALLRRLQFQRRGFNFFGATEDPKIHARALSIQSAVLDHLLSPVVLQRMTDSALYGGDYSPTEMILDLTDAVYGSDLTTGANSFRRNLQILYLERLVALANNPGADPVTRSAALAGAENIEARLGFLGGVFSVGLSPEARAHRQEIRRILRRLG